MEIRKRIALVAHDNKKRDLLEWARFNCELLIQHELYATGTTFAFTDYLSKVSPDWKSQVGSATSVKWPVGLGGKGNEGVSGTVAQTEGALGYVELAYALQNKLPYGSVQNKAGEYVKATTEAVQAAKVKPEPNSQRAEPFPAPMATRD